MTVFFIGAGPGDSELITLKGKRLITEADIIIYAGSLVNPAVLEGCRQDAEIYNSALMDLDEMVAIMIQGVKAGKKVVRVHTGDPSIYGAIREQIDRLEAEGVVCEVVPGVSSFTAAAALLQKEYTLPGVSQTVIVTRLSGRTVVPEKENLACLARHHASMAIFLSVGMIEEVTAQLIPAYGENTPAAVVEKATWPDQRVIRGNLKTIARQVKEAGIEKTALILVGGFLEGPYEQSKLYDKTFSHGYRRGQA